MQGSSLNSGNYVAAKRNFVDTTMPDVRERLKAASREGRNTSAEFSTCIHCGPREEARSLLC